MEIIEPALHVTSSGVVVLVYSIFVMTDRMRPVMTDPGSLTSTMTLALVLALGTNMTYFVGRAANVEICPQRLLAAAVALATLLLFATVDCWNAVRYQERIGEHNKDTKKEVQGPNDRANTVAAGVFFELLISLALLAVQLSHLLEGCLVIFYLLPHVLTPIFVLKADRHVVLKLRIMPRDDGSVAPNREHNRPRCVTDTVVYICGA